MNPRTRGRIAASLAGGVAASLAMDLVQDGFAALFERDRSEGDLDEEVEAIVSVVRALGTLVPSLTGERRTRAAGRAIHYVFGIGFAAAYVVGHERAPWLGTSRGLVFGTALFLLSDLVLIPTFKLGRSWERYSRAERANALLSHVAYGIVVDLARSRYAVPQRRAEGDAA